MPGQCFAVQLCEGLIGKYLQFSSERPRRLHNLHHRYDDKFFLWIYPEGRSRGTAPVVLSDRAYNSAFWNVGDDTKPEPKPASPGRLAARPRLYDRRQVIHRHELNGLGRQDAYALKLAAVAEHLGETQVVHRR